MKPSRLHAAVIGVVTRLLIFWTLFVIAANQIPAQVSVTLQGAGPITFDTQPDATSWSTLSIGPNSSGSITTTAALSAAVRTNNAANILSALPVGSGAPPAANALAIWNATGGNLITRPTTNIYTLLMGRFVNNCGGALKQVDLSYDFSQSASLSEEVPGHLGFYSVGGAPGSWTQIPAASGVSNGLRQATLNLGNWAPGESLFVLWGDDNGSAASDSAYAIDNVSIAFPALALVSEPLDQLAAPGGMATFSVAAVGIAPLQFQWLRGTDFVDGATNSALTLTNLSEADNGGYSVMVTDARETLISRAALLTVACVPFTFSIQLTNKALDIGAPLLVTAAVTGTPPYSVQWYKDGAPLISSTNKTSSYSRSSASLGDSGAYVVVASNCAGFATSAVASISVSCMNPPVITLTPTGQNLFTGATLTLTASATSSSPMQYQWYRYDTPIPGATNGTLVKTNVVVSDTGLYRIIASNCAGTTSSTGVLVSVADRPFTVVALTNHAWRYNQDGVDLGSAWRDSAYNDSTWPGGVGVFSREDNSAIVLLTHTLLNLTSTTGEFIPTFYFRTRFVITNDPAEMFLVATNLVDDGLVVYVNGREAYRVNMPGGAITYSTFAPGTLTEPAYWVTNITSDFLVQGTNTLAVEVHQVNATSADVVMGFHANLARPAPTELAITKQPDDLVVPEAQKILLSVAVNGAPFAFQWFKNGVAIEGATGRELVIANAAQQDSGLYAVLVSNAVSRIMSRLAKVSVIRDIVPPRVIAADHVDSTHILLSFSEPIFAGSVAVGDFRVVGSEEIAVTAAEMVSPTNILLTTSAIVGPGDYVAQVTGLTDISSDHLPIAEGSRVPVARRAVILPVDSAWYFFDPYPEVGDSLLAPEGWNLSSFSVPPDWGYAPGGYIAGVFGELPSVPFNSGLSVSSALTSYFRKEFDLNASRAGLRLFADLFCNDGAILYLNGHEAARINMPDESTYATPSASNVVGVLSNRIELPAALLAQRSNVLAVELHQPIPNDFTKAFALTLSGRVESELKSPLTLFAGPYDTTVEEGHPVSFGVSAAGVWSFQWRVNGQDVPGATAPEFSFVPGSGLDGAAISVRLANASTFVLSSNAVLRVIADVTAPRLFTAKATNDIVIANFSEAVAVSSAENPANYVIRDGAGNLFPVLSATLARGTNVTLRGAAPIFVGSFLVVSNISNTAVVPIVIAPGSAVPIASSAIVLPLDAVWRYEQSGGNLGAAWKLPGFDDSTWPSGPALFWAKQGAETILPMAVGTQLNLLSSNTTVDVPSYYFRTTITLPYTVTSGADESLR